MAGWMLVNVENKIKIDDSGLVHPVLKIPMGYTQGSSVGPCRA